MLYQKRYIFSDINIKYLQGVCDYKTLGKIMELGLQIHKMGMSYQKEEIEQLGQEIGFDLFKAFLWKQQLVMPRTKLN